MTIRRALILDTETTGLDPIKDRCIEVGCILYDLERGALIASYSSLMQSKSNEAVGINRIDPALLTEARPPSLVWGDVADYILSADVILAHRAEFDRSFTPPEIAKLKPWVCMKFHVEWPGAANGEHLVHLALHFDVGVVSAHRAMTDCDILARILTRVHETSGYGMSLVRLIERAMRPRVKVVSTAPFSEKDRVKAAGFAWNPDKKEWWKDVPEEELEKIPFAFRIA